MKLVYDPPGGKREEWAFEAGQLTIAEAVSLEKTLDMTLSEAFNQCVRGSVICMREFLLLLRRRSDSNIQLRDLNDIQISHLLFVDDEDADDEAPKDEAEESPEDLPAE